MVDKIRSKQFIVTVVGTTGSADSVQPINGRLLAIHLNYSGGMVATADVTITRLAEGDMPTETLLTVSNNAADGWFRPRAALVDSVNATIAGVFDTYAILGRIEVSVVQGTNTETVEVTILYEAS